MRIRQWLRGRDVAVVYAAILLAVALALALGPPEWRDDVIDFSSTNLANLRRRPLIAMVLSAFILPSAFAIVQIPLVIIAFGATQRWLGRGATIVAAIFGHVGATLFVAVMLVTGITHGLIDPSVRTEDDVGVSYAVVALAGLCTVRITTMRLRLLYAIILSGWLLSAVLISRTFTDFGHLIAWLIGLSLAVIVVAARKTALST